MRSRSTAVLSVAALAALALAGCSAGSAGPGASATKTPAPVVESSYASPAAVGDRTGIAGDDLQVWSASVPDSGAAASLGDPEAGNEWVTVNVAQWVAASGKTDVDAAPVLRSTADKAVEGKAVSPRAVAVPMTEGKLYTFVWSFQVPEASADASTLVLCTSAADDAACSSIAK